MLRPRPVALVTLALVAFSIAAPAADNFREEFTRAWTGKTVVVKRPLYTLSYDERGVMGKTYRDRRDGLNVVTPFKGSYFQFDGRQKKDHLTSLDPQRLVDQIKAEYQGDNLDVRAYQKVQPNLLNRYDPGASLVVRTVRVERDLVRLVLLDQATDFGDEPATFLTVHWPTPFSKSFTERDAVEGLILQYLHLQPVR
jgi:hypothetical protein